MFLCEFRQSIYDQVEDLQGQVICPCTVYLFLQSDHFLIEENTFREIIVLALPFLLNNDWKVGSPVLQLPKQDIFFTLHFCCCFDQFWWGR